MPRAYRSFTPGNNPPRRREAEPPAAFGAPLRLAPDIYIAHTQPGLEEVLWNEIGARSPGARELGRREVPDRAAMEFFHADHPQALAALRTAEDLFMLVGYRRGMPDDRSALEQVRSAVAGAPYVAQGLAARTRVTVGARTGRRLGFRVIARAAGEHQFRRVDFQRAVERGILDRGDHAWRAREDRPDVEFWATLLGGEMLLALRLSDDRMRQRDYKVAHRPGSLRPAVAAALAILSRPARDDVFLDPMCGAGTILIERAYQGRYRMLLGGDSDPPALAAARANVGPRHRPIGLFPWDATALPLPDHSVTALVTNLPWGIRHGSHNDNRRLYPRLLAEFHRVIRPGGKMVLLTGETALMREMAARGLSRPERIIDVSVLGARAAIHVAHPN